MKNYTKENFTVKYPLSINYVAMCGKYLVIDHREVLGSLSTFFTPSAVIQYNTTQNARPAGIL